VSISEAQKRDTGGDELSKEQIVLNCRRIRYRLLRNCGTLC
jgi:hypothetical protein